MEISQKLWARMHLSLQIDLTAGGVCCNNGMLTHTEAVDWKDLNSRVIEIAWNPLKLLFLNNKINLKHKVKLEELLNFQ